MDRIHKRFTAEQEIVSQDLFSHPLYQGTVSTGARFSRAFMLQAMRELGRKSLLGSPGR